ncbi:MAG: metal-dependent hydrolase [Thermomicrobiales bacterium]|nr:metal-dependent hydrolase [Thermomicrobiales bacterium]
MKRGTHLIMGAAIAVPVAVLLPPVGAIGAVWLGRTGGALPDYLDLRSDARRALRHRGVSHSLLVVAMTAWFVWLVLDALSRESLAVIPVPDRYVQPWAAALALGMVSHLLGDACTRAGIQPLLPLLRWRFWLLPRFLRGRSDGSLNLFARGGSSAILGVGIAFYVWML